MPITWPPRGIMEKKYGTVHYRRLRRDGDVFPSKSLAAAIVEAMEKPHRTGATYSKDWRLRVAVVPRAQDHRRFINDFHANDEAVFGNVCVFTPGEMQALIEIESRRSAEEADRASIEAVDIAEDRAPEGMEYLRGIAYWLAVNDHFFMIQHSAMQTKGMEEYLTWLLRDETSIIGQDHFVELQAAFDVSAVGGDLADVKSIEIGGLVPETVRDVNEPANRAEPAPGKTVEVVERSTVGDLRAMFDKGKKIIEDLLGEMEAKKLMDSIPPDAALDVTVNIGYRAKKRKIEKEFMRNLASGLRNMPEGEVRIRGKDGAIKGDEARLQTNMPFKRIRDGSMLLDLEDARTQLIRVYHRFIEDGKITA